MLTDLIARLAAPAAGGGQQVAVQLLTIARQVVGVLRIQVVELADGAQAKADMVAVTMTGKALAIAAQASVFLGQRQVIVRAYELAQANVVITGSFQVLEGDRAHRALVGIRRQRPRPLLLVAPGAWA